MQGAVGWLTAITAFIGAVTALFNALSPVLKRLLQKMRQKDRGKAVEHTHKTSVKWNILFMGMVLLFVSAGAFDYVIKPPLISLSEERTNAAWLYFKKGEPNPLLKSPVGSENLNRAIEIADSVITDLKGPANVKEHSLTRDGVPIPPIGEVTDTQRKVILSYGPLNDVATCLWIKGRSYQYLNRTNDSLYAYLQLTNYPHARTWDIKGWFWSPTEDSFGQIETLTRH